MSTSSPETEHGRNLGLWPLIGLIIGSMIGAGIFHLPAQIAQTAASGPMLVGWAVFGAGMIFLSWVFQNLGRVAPNVDGGVYGYARDGFGNYLGFATAWGYWLSTWTGSTGYLVLLFASLGRYFPDIFGGGNTGWAILGASLVLWTVHALILSGIKQATIVNAFVSAAKVIPLLVFLVLGVTAWRSGVFTADFWGRLTQVDAGDGATPLGSPAHQVMGMMLLLVWYFLGIESVSIYAARARHRRDAARATTIGFGVVLALLVGVNVLSFAITEHATLAGYEDPSLAGVLRDAVGPWGAHLVIAGVVISLVGAYTSWMLLSSEILMYPGKDGNLPTWFGRENRRGVPVAGLWLTSICMQVMLIWTLFNDATYTQLTVLAGAMVLLPYLWSALYQVLIAARRRHAYAEHPEHRTRDLAMGIVASVFALFLVYAGGLDYVLVAALAIALGTILYVIARRQRGLPAFVGREWILLGAVIIGAIAGAVMLATGAIAM